MVTEMSEGSRFYSASALIAMQIAVIATADLSVRPPSVDPSVTFRCFVYAFTRL